MPDNQLQPSSKFILYQDDNGVTNVNVRFDGKDVWLPQQQIAMLFDTTQQNVSLHINSILDEGELLKEATHKYFLLVRQEGNRPLLHGAGSVSHEKAIEKATQEFEEYRRKEMLQYESDFDRAVKELKSIEKTTRKLSQ